MIPLALFFSNLGYVLLMRVKRMNMNPSIFDLHIFRKFKIYHLYSQYLSYSYDFTCFQPHPETDGKVWFFSWCLVSLRYWPTIKKNVQASYETLNQTWFLNIARHLNSMDTYTQKEAVTQVYASINPAMVDKVTSQYCFRLRTIT